MSSRLENRMNSINFNLKSTTTFNKLKNTIMLFRFKNILYYQYYEKKGSVTKTDIFTDIGYSHK